MALIDGGYIILSRKLIESEIWQKPPLYLKVWIYLLSRAQHKQYKELQRGELRTSIPEIIEACSWYIGYRKMKPNKDQIYQIIDWLRKVSEAVNEDDTNTPMITTTRATHGLLVSIVNYNIYQNPKNYESSSEDDNENDTKATREQRQPNNINKNDKNEIMKEDIYSSIIDYLNEKTGKNFKSTTSKTRSLINVRIKEGFTLEDFKKVIDMKTTQWKDNFDKDGKPLGVYLRPETLFGNKMEGYVNEDFEANKERSGEPKDPYGGLEIY